MTSQVNPEEVRAILDLVQPRLSAAAEVAERDFREPKRLNAKELERLAGLARKSKPAAESELRSWLRSPHEVEIAHVSEANAVDLVRSLAEPFALFVFDCAGRPCFALWEPTACVALIETALGASEVKDPQARRLSSVEVELLSTIAMRIVSAVCATFSIEAKNLRVIQDLETLQTLEVGKTDADPQRIAVHLSIDGPVGASNLRLFLAGIQVAKSATEPHAKEKARAALPPHLGQVSAELGAQLGSADIPLSELLSIEVGDVIPLAVEVGSPLDLYVEGKPCGTAKWGSNRGALAIRIQSLLSQAAER